MTKTVQIDISRLLPDVTDAHDACLVRLVSTLEAHKGVVGVHVVQGSSHRPQQLCIHYDTSEHSVDSALELTTALSETLQVRFGHLSARVASPSMACETVERLRGLAGVRSVESAADGFVHVEYSRDRTSEAAIRTVLDGIGANEDGA